MEQNQYDEQSNHGLNQEQQLIWESKIARELEELHTFAYPVKNQALDTRR
jgi:hypothetical protein